MEESFETWAVDLVGWGFSDSGAAKHRKEMKLGPKQKRDHLYAFWEEKVSLAALVRSLHTQLIVTLQTANWQACLQVLSQVCCQHSAVVGTPV